MRYKARHDPLSARAIAGSHVVLLGLDMAPARTDGLLGFALERTDHTENERYWLKGFKTFAETDPGYPRGSLVSTLEHPLQTFLWGDFTAKPHHTYTYRVVALRGRPKDLRPSESVELRVSTEEEDTGVHAVYFNRGVAGSQAYARKFQNRRPEEVEGGAAWTWLSRGLLEAMLAFIGQARGEGFGLRAAVYEFQYLPVLKAFAAARRRGADVRIVFDGRGNASNYPARANRKAIAAAHIAGVCTPRRANPSWIAHNKFIVLLEHGRPTQVWTGSTNVTDGGIFGHSNVGHIVRDPTVAASYLAYWQDLATDPQGSALRPDNEQRSPVPHPLPPAESVRTIFSPRASLEALEWYAERLDAARESVFFTAAFGVNDLFERVLEKDKPYLRYVLLERRGTDAEAISRDRDNRIAVGNVLGETAYGRWLRERLVPGLNTHVKYVHTKYMLVDPLGEDPLVITGSANFSDASTRNNDENMLVIRGDTRVADLYLTEFMRLFNHFYFRDWVARRAHADGAGRGGHLRPDDSWLALYYRQGSPRYKERVLFAG